MAVVHVESDEVEQVWVWRYREFRRMGFDEVDAEVMAESEADLHRAAEMLEKGCSFELLAEILT